jgi:drug/metabolite transporter (DMT)-like permease
MEENTWSIQNKKMTKKLAIWSMLWTSSMALATFGPKFIWDENVPLTIIAVVINALLGIGMILMNIKHINSLDDLQKKIQLDAMGIALGAGIVGGLTYTLLDITNLITNDAEIAFLVMFISVTYLIALLIGQKRYK